MKKIIMIALVSLITTQNAWSAACPETAASTAAKGLRLSGKVLLETKTADGKTIISADEDLAKQMTKKSEDYKLLVEEVTSRNSEVISSAFGFKDDGTVIVVIRNIGNCALSILGTDGESIEVSPVIESSVKTNSISAYRDGSTIVTVTKVKPSKILRK